MRSRTTRSPGRPASSGPPGPVTVLGVALVLGELVGGAVILAGGRSGLAALGGGSR